MAIIVIDDHALTRDMVRTILRQFGFSNISAAEDGKKALERLTADVFDLVICDWNMPIMSGIELLRAVRGPNQLNQMVKFLMLTGEAYRENVKEAASLGVSAYIAKPFTAGTLADCIDRIFAKVP